MHLAIDAVGAQVGGAAVVLDSVLKAALHHTGVTRVTAFVSPGAGSAYGLPRDSRLHYITEPTSRLGGVGRLAWQFGGLPLASERIRADRLLCLSGGGVGGRKVPHSTFIQQALALTSPSELRPGLAQRSRLAAIRAAMRLSNLGANSVIVQTDHMAALVAKVLRVEEARIHVCRVTPPPLPVTEESELPAMAKVPRRARLLYVGSTSPHKNFDTLARAIPLLRRNDPDATLFATIPLDHPMSRVEGIIALGHLDRHEVARAYRDAHVLVMPSLVESACLPLLEAVSQSMEIAAADRPYAREVCRDGAIYFDPSSPETCSKAILQLRDAPPAAALARRQAREALIREWRDISTYDEMIRAALS